MTQYLTVEQLNDLSAQVDEQLADLESAAFMQKGLSDNLKQLPKQCKAIENIVKENIDSFLQKFAEKAKEVICHADSDLHKRYAVYGGLKKDEVLEKFAGLLAVMGFSGAALNILTVAIVVYVLHIGLKQFSEKYCFAAIKGSE